MITINQNKVIAPDTITLGKRWVLAQGFEADDLVTMFEMLWAADKSGTLESKTKLKATYAWLMTVKGMAKSGAAEFPSAPFTFKEVVTE